MLFFCSQGLENALGYGPESGLQVVFKTNPADDLSKLVSNTVFVRIDVGVGNIGPCLEMLHEKASRQSLTVITINRVRKVGVGPLVRRDAVLTALTQQS